MSQKCDGCGVEPPPEVRFQQQPIPFRPTKTLCPLCYQKLEERFLRGVLLINLAMGLLGLVFLWQNPRSEMGHILVNLGFLAMFALSAIVPHELAHACVGRLMGLKVAEVWIGRGADLLITRVFAFQLGFKALPVAGLAF